MRADTLTDTFTALRELPRAVLHSVAPAVPRPVRHAQLPQGARGDGSAWAWCALWEYGAPAARNQAAACAYCLC